MKRISFKEYLVEYYKYFNAFSDVVDKETDGVTKVNKDDDSEKRSASQRMKNADKVERGDDEEDYHPCKFRQWMEISVAGDS